MPVRLCSGRTVCRKEARMPVRLCSGRTVCRKEARMPVRLCSGRTDRYMLPAVSAFPPSMAVICRKQACAYMDGGGRAKHDARAESNAGSSCRNAGAAMYRSLPTSCLPRHQHVHVRRMCGQIPAPCSICISTIPGGHMLQEGKAPTSMFSNIEQPVNAHIIALPVTEA